MNKLKNPIIETTSGKLEGITEKGVYVFKGIPYAAPPLGGLRWRPPRPHQPWKGVRQAGFFGAAAPQNPSNAGSIREFRVDEAQSEDCLSLNIWTPVLDNARRPVMVWIHGGYFTMGSGAQPVFHGNHLASRWDTVVVTLNYRLGLFGFLNLNEVTRGRIPATGNEGLLDQIAALEWIRDNIAVFGGDPYNITVFGESAGGMSIECLMTMPRARGLFQKAILESSMDKAVKPLAEAVRTAENWLNISGLPGRDFEDLKELPVESILFTQKKLAAGSAKTGMPAAPIIDGNVLPMLPQEAFQSGQVPDIPLLIGTNLEEYRLFRALHPSPGLDEAALKDRIQQMAPLKYVPEIIEFYRKSRAERGESVAPADILSAVRTDFNFRLPARRLLEARSKNRQIAYSYLFTWKSPAQGGIFGACHGMEIGFVFGNYDADFGGSGPEAELLAAQMQDAWTSFARTGDPGCASLGTWPQYGKNRKTMLLGQESRVEESPREKGLDIWDILETS